MSYNIVSFLKSINWRKYQTLYALGFERDNIDYTISKGYDKCSYIISLVQTRCLFSANMMSFILNRTDRWKKLNLYALISNLSLYKAISIEIDVNSNIDHIFTLFEYNGQWYITQSYIKRYNTIIEPVDINTLLSDIHSWEQYGVNPSQWRKYFHADINATDKVTTHIYATSRIIPSDIYSSIKVINDRISYLLGIKGSYIYNNTYKCILNEYIS